MRHRFGSALLLLLLRAAHAFNGQNAASGLLCKAKTNLITASWDGGWQNEHTLFEVQVGIFGHSSFKSVTTLTPHVDIEDLKPDTEYQLETRKRSCFLGIRLSCHWTDLSHRTTCRTSPLSLHQPHLLPPQGNSRYAPEPFSIGLHIDEKPPRDDELFRVAIRPLGENDWGKSYTMHFRQGYATIGNLQAATVYEVQVQAWHSQA